MPFPRVQLERSRHNLPEGARSSHGCTLPSYYRQKLQYHPHTGLPIRFRSNQHPNHRQCRLGVMNWLSYK